jgi:hypothetical protein
MSKAISEYEVEYYLRDCTANSYIIKNSQVHNLIKKLITRVYASSGDKYERRWEDFYLPLKEMENKLVYLLVL